MTAPKRLTPEALAAIEACADPVLLSPIHSLVAEVRAAWAEIVALRADAKEAQRQVQTLTDERCAAEARVAELERAEQSIASLANFIRDREGEIDWPKLPAGRAISTIKALDERVAELLQAQESHFDCHAGPGTSTPACGGCTTCLTNRVATLEALLDGEGVRDKVANALSDLESLLRAATPRPWKHFTSVSRTGMHLGDGILFPEGSKRRELVYLNGDEKTPDLVLVAALRNLAPELIAVARAAEELRKRELASDPCAVVSRMHLDTTLAALRAKIGEAT